MADSKAARLVAQWVASMAVWLVAYLDNMWAGKTAKRLVAMMVALTVRQMVEHLADSLVAVRVAD